MTANFCGHPLNTRQDAINCALMVAEGKLSRLWNNAISNSEGGLERVQALAACTQADAADVQMLCALAAVLPGVFESGGA